MYCMEVFEMEGGKLPIIADRRGQGTFWIASGPGRPLAICCFNQPVPPAGQVGARSTSSEGGTGVGERATGCAILAPPGLIVCQRL
jgi:hypothetical protein